MEILTHKDKESYIIKLRGELDANTAEVAEKILDEVVKLHPNTIRVDCKDLKYISSRGLGVFISRFQEIQDKKINFSLFNMSNHIRHIFKIIGLDELMEIHSEVVPNSNIVNQ
ncbi:STAS domain-containing protein [Adhaeribacter aquaticus]|uniref:STAS domain-containing protein n=1 Tax=Adhaeribacter aquaticus TaxID=299567 RepID=UPI0003FA8F9F|nr:STAS domain-containing protein [Adhaeribacter aquaticus]